MGALTTTFRTLIFADFAGFFGKFANSYLHEIYLILLSAKRGPREFFAEACFSGVSVSDIFQESDIFHAEIIPHCVDTGFEGIQCK